MSVEAEPSDTDIRSLIPTNVRFRNPDETQTFCEHIRIVIANFKSGQEVFPSPNDFTQMTHFHNALCVAVKKKRDADWTHVANLFGGLSQYSIRNLASRAKRHGKILPRSEDFRTQIGRLENAQTLMSIIRYGVTFKSDGSTEPLLWVRKKSKKTDTKTDDYQIFIEGLAVAWDAAFKQESGKFSAKTQSKRDTPTPFVEFCRNLFRFLKIDKVVNIENLVNKMSLPSNKNSTGNALTLKE
jgi:hypothetical protein